jgi:ketosteroid isomerase-like protein
LSQHGVDRVIETYRETLQLFVNGDPAPMAELFSQRDDVILANPLGPPRVGWADVEAGIKEAGANFTRGSFRADEVSRYATADLAYVLQLERIEAQLAGSDDTVRISLRATIIFRREGDSWKILLRHADPITTARPMGTVVEA